MRSAHRAFSIIELIAVIAIMVILISLLAPVLGGTRTAARDVTLSSAMRQLGAALVIYANDNRDMFPYIVSPGDIEPEVYEYSVTDEFGAAVTDPNHWSLDEQGLYFDFNARFWLTALQDSAPAIAELGRTKPSSDSPAYRFERADGSPLSRSFAELTYSSSATAELWTPVLNSEGVGGFGPSAYSGRRIGEMVFPSDKAILVGPRWQTQEDARRNSGLLACTMGDGSVRGIDIISDERFAGTVRRGSGVTAGPWITPEGIRGRDVPLVTAP